MRGKLKTNMTTRIRWEQKIFSSNLHTERFTCSLKRHDDLSWISRTFLRRTSPEGSVGLKTRGNFKWRTPENPAEPSGVWMSLRWRSLSKRRKTFWALKLKWNINQIRNNPEEPLKGSYRLQISSSSHGSCSPHEDMLLLWMSLVCTNLQTPPSRRWTEWSRRTHERRQSADLTNEARALVSEVYDRNKPNA